MKATGSHGQLSLIPNCSITVNDPNNPIQFYIMPDISDSKSANYHDENIMGRSTTVKSFDTSGVRTISMELHFIALKEADIYDNLANLKLLQSALYPRTGTQGSPYLPPQICKIVCGELLGHDGVCAVLKSYSIRFDTTQVLHEATLLPYKFDLSTTWDVVYGAEDLPNANKIIANGS